MLFDLNLVKYVHELGLQEGCLRILAQIGIKFESSGSLPPIGPILVISNHTGMPDTLALLATANRKDFYHVALSTYRDILEKYNLEIYRRFIPIYRNANYRDIIPRLVWGDTYTYLQRNKHRSNIENKKSISRAAALLNSGNTVAIFPQGSVGKSITNSGWRAGVGHLVKQIERNDIQVVFVYIRGTNRMDIFRFLKPVRSLFKNKKVTVRHSKPLTLSALGVDVSKSGKEIAKQIERKYYEEAKEYL